MQKEIIQKETIINTLKTQYSRELRKQLVKTILTHEKSKDEQAIEQSYHLINQIFSYVLKECHWSMVDNSQDWDNSPLQIMSDVFPKLSTTLWYKDKAIVVKNHIDVVMKEQ